MLFWGHGRVVDRRTVLVENLIVSVDLDSIITREAAMVPGVTGLEDRGLQDLE
jgi:hypothetical protein